MAKEAIYNSSQRGATLRKVAIGIGYEVAPHALKDMLLALVRGHPRVASEPAPTVRITEFGATMVVYELQFWVTKFEEGVQIEDELRSQLWYRLRRARIALPVGAPYAQVAQPDDAQADAVAIDIPELLAHVDFLSVISAAQRAELSRRAVVFCFGRGEVIISQGAVEDGPFYIVASGEVSVRVRAPTGDETEVARLGPRGFFGEMAVLTGEPRTASVVALTDTTLVGMARSDFAELFTRDPPLAQALTAVLAQRRQGLADAITAAKATRSPPAPESSQLLDRLWQIFRQLT